MNRFRASISVLAVALALLLVGCRSSQAVSRTPSVPAIAAVATVYHGFTVSEPGWTLVPSGDNL